MYASRGDDLCFSRERLDDLYQSMSSRFPEIDDVALGIFLSACIGYILAHASNLTTLHLDLQPMMPFTLVLYMMNAQPRLGEPVLKWLTTLAIYRHSTRRAGFDDPREIGDTINQTIPVELLDHTCLRSLALLDMDFRHISEESLRRYRRSNLALRATHLALDFAREDVNLSGSPKFWSIFSSLQQLRISAANVDTRDDPPPALRNLLGQEPRRLAPTLNHLIALLPRRMSTPESIPEYDGGPEPWTDEMQALYDEECEDRIGPLQSLDSLKVLAADLSDLQSELGVPNLHEALPRSIEEFHCHRAMVGYDHHLSYITSLAGMKSTKYPSLRRLRVSLQWTQRASMNSPSYRPYDSLDQNLEACSDNGIQFGIPEDEFLSFERLECGTSPLDFFEEAEVAMYEPDWTRVASYWREYENSN